MSRRGTSPNTQADLDQLALERAAYTGAPALAVGFSSSGEATVYDAREEGALTPVSEGVRVWPSLPPRP